MLTFNLLRLDQREKLHNNLCFFGGVHCVSGFCLGDGQSKTPGTIVKKKKGFGHNPPQLINTQQTNRYPKLFGKVANIDHGFIVGGFHV